MEKATPIHSPMDPHAMPGNEACEDKPAHGAPYLSIVGSLMFAAPGTRPDIAFSITTLSRYNVQPLQMHLTAARRVLRYLATTRPKGLLHPTTSSERLRHGYSDSDWTGRTSTGKSVGGYILIYGEPISWKAKSQSVVALSNLEAEYITSSDATREAIWLRRMRNDKSAPDIVAPDIVAPDTTKIRVGCDNPGSTKAHRHGGLQS